MVSSGADGYQACPHRARLVLAIDHGADVYPAVAQVSTHVWINEVRLHAESVGHRVGVSIYRVNRRDLVAHFESGSRSSSGYFDLAMSSFGITTNG